MKRSHTWRGASVATLVKPGTIPFRISKVLLAKSTFSVEKPVILPPGRERFLMRPDANGLAAQHHDNRHGCSDRTQGAHRDRAFRHDDIDAGVDHRDRQFRQPAHGAVAPLRNEHEIASLHVAMLGEPAKKRLKLTFGQQRAAEVSDASHIVESCRGRSERPRHRGCANTKKNSPPHVRPRPQDKSSYRLDGPSGKKIDGLCCCRMLLL